MSLNPAGFGTPASSAASGGSVSTVVVLNASTGSVTGQSLNPLTVVPSWITSVPIYNLGPAPHGGGSTLLTVRPRAYYIPFRTARACSVDSLSVYITTIGSGDASTYVGIYASSATNYSPTTLLGSGAVASNVTGLRTAAVAASFGTGVLYWAASTSTGTVLPTVAAIADVNISPDYWPGGNDPVGTGPSFGQPTHLRVAQSAWTLASSYSDGGVAAPGNTASNVAIPCVFGHFDT